MQPERPNVLYSQSQIASAVERIARQISDDFRGQEIVLLVVLKGAFIFAADLSRTIERLAASGKGVDGCRIEFMRVSSYGDGQQPGDLKIVFDSDFSLRDRNVIIVEDIGDTLHTLGKLQELLGVKEPRTLRTAVLLTKPDNHRLQVPIDYAGFAARGIGFVVGYGMDKAGTWRGLPYIGQI